MIVWRAEFCRLWCKAWSRIFVPSEIEEPLLVQVQLGGSRSKSVATSEVLRQPFEDMKRPLGRGLENLMSAADDSSSSLTDALGGEARQDSRGGVERLIQGSSQLELGQTSSRPFSGAPKRLGENDLRPAQVPGWVFYLGDLVLMAAVVWLIVLSPEPLERRQMLVCLGLVVMGASIGVWPWLRNVLYCQGIGAVTKLPKWVLARDVEIGGEQKHLVIHLQQPYLAVDVSETSWNGTNLKPFWVDGPPNLPPGGVKALLDEAESFYRDHVDDVGTEASSHSEDLGS